ncbi:hypothetical protein A9Q99_09310 [Gammaproteobacteria bacterium 45_16_T64]|nr:hypothetical protein A9Q99_09310 [Gammaproteobacteria bacterium 45_16_T64]
MDEHLVISALGADKPGIINELSRLTLDQECNILDTRMTVLGDAFALLMMVSGPGEALSTLRQNLSHAATSLELTVTFQNAQSKPHQEPALPYQALIIAIDNLGIVHDITGFFSDKLINIEEMHTETYAAPHTGTRMFSLSVEIKIPGGLNISNLKEEFATFCDELNLDASIEPCK